MPAAGSRKPAAGPPTRRGTARMPNRFLTWFDRTLLWLAMTAFIVMMLATLGQVVFRYVLEVPVPWTEELARVLFVQAMLIGMAIAVREDEHIVVDFLFKRLPPRGRQILGLVFGTVVLLLLAILIRGAWSMIATNWNARLVSLSWVRVGYLYIGLFVSLASMALYTALGLAARWQALTARRGMGS